MKVRIKRAITPWLKKHHLFYLAKILRLLGDNLILTLTFLIGILLYAFPDRLRYRKIIQEKAKRLIIIAHPDDETLFFSRILLKDGEDTVVFCLTNGYNPVRRREFYKALRFYGTKGLIMKLPDRTAFSFLFSEAAVTRTLRGILRHYPACECVYTHNPEGEYGHWQHRMIARRASRIFDRSRIMVPVFQREIEKEQYRLQEPYLSRKREICRRIYKSQAETMDKVRNDWVSHEKVVALPFCV